ncbi:hypothetical protein YC2023_019577 [Brassica napus]
MTSVGVRQHTKNVCGCLSAHTGRPWTVHQYKYQHAGPSCGLTSVAVRQHTQDVRGLSISTHISTLALPVDCSGDFGTSGLSVQYTQDVRGCPSAHTGRPWLSVSTHIHTGRPWVSVSTHKTSMAVRQHTQDIRGLSISTHISTFVFGLITLALPVDCSGDFGHVGCVFSTHRTSVGVRQHTQDVRGCPSSHTGRPWLSVSIDTGHPWTVHQYTYQHAGP